MRLQPHSPCSFLRRTEACFLFRQKILRRKFGGHPRLPKLGITSIARPHMLINSPSFTYSQVLIAELSAFYLGFTPSLSFSRRNNHSVSRIHHGGNFTTLFHHSLNPVATFFQLRPNCGKFRIFLHPTPHALETTSLSPSSFARSGRTCTNGFAPTKHIFSTENENHRANWNSTYTTHSTLKLQSPFVQK
jgi:hypothetical protein